MHVVQAKRQRRLVDGAQKLVQKGLVRGGGATEPGLCNKVTEGPWRSKGIAFAHQDGGNLILQGVCRRAVTNHVVLHALHDPARAIRLLCVEESEQRRLGQIEAAMSRVESTR